MSDLPKFSLIKHLEKHAPLICDGNKSLALQALGFPETQLAFMANLSHPDLVVEISKAYSRAGASVVRTNTDGANILLLEAMELGERAENINNNGMSLLRDGVGMAGIPAASVISAKAAITGELSSRFLEKAYGEQLIFLADTGAKFVILSDFSDLDDLLIAVRMSKRAVQKELVAHWHIEEQSGTDVHNGLKQLKERGSDFVGIQASWKMEGLVSLVEELIEEFGVLSVLLDEVPTSDAAEAAEVSGGYQTCVQELLSREVAILGGGKNTTVAHTQTTSNILKSLLEES